MNVAFFSETGDNKKYPRDFPNSRTEVAWCIALDAPMCSLEYLPDEHFDLGIVIIPKNNPKVDLESIRKCCDKVAVMQEGPHWYFQDYSVEEQFNYFNTLMDSDWVYCHNESDVNYYRGLGCEDTRVMRSLMIPHNLLPRSEWGDVTIIGGNMVSWYGGFDSFMLASSVTDEIYQPKMGRALPNEQQLGITQLPYLQWSDWIRELNKRKMGIHMMRTHAAGTFALNCSYLGIPCVGYGELDTQWLLHPNLSVKNGDLEKARKLVNKLWNDLDFYEENCILTKQLYKERYSEEVFKEGLKL